MFFCRAYRKSEAKVRIVIGEGVTLQLAYQDAERNSPELFGPDWNISFWRGQKVNDARVEFTATIVVED